MNRPYSGEGLNGTENPGLPWARGTWQLSLELNYNIGSFLGLQADQVCTWSVVLLPFCISNLLAHHTDFALASQHNDVNQFLKIKFFYVYIYISYWFCFTGELCLLQKRILIECFWKRLCVVSSIWLYFKILLPIIHSLATTHRFI